MKKKSLAIIISIILLGILLFVLYYLNTNNRVETYNITLNDGEEIELQYGEKYLENGYIAVNSNNQDVTEKVTIIGSVDENNPGEYQLKYRNIIKERTVIVKEKNKNEESIQFELKGKKEISILKGTKSQEEGYIARSKENTIKTK